jgi:FkbM family methyltransferase
MSVADAACDLSGMNRTGAAWEGRGNWQRAERDNCTCPNHLSLHTILSTDSGVRLRAQVKQCMLDLPKQRIASMTMSAPVLDMPAYTAYEVDRGTYGNLPRIMGRSAAPSWVDIGANLGFFSISVALANPHATGWAYEPNPLTFAFLQRNIAANGVGDRVHAVNAGVSSDGRTLRMPRCVVASNAGSQMASTQWARPVYSKISHSSNSCFSAACKRKVAETEECMKADARMVAVRSVTLEQALASALREGNSAVDLLKVDCEGCEHEVMSRIELAASEGSDRGVGGGESGRHIKRISGVRKVTGECHAIRGLTDPQKEKCLKVLRGVRGCPHGITPFLTCRGKPRDNKSG